MIVDTHVHYNLDPLYEQWRTHWDEAQAAGVGQSIVVGVDKISNARALEIVESEEHLYCTLGVHPTDSNELTDDRFFAELTSQIQAHRKKVVAVGECGLDYFRLPKNPDEAEQEKRKQKTLFGKQIQLAKTLRLPLILHCRDAQEDLLDVIHHFSVQDGIVPKAVLHCMSGTVDHLKTALEMGFFISYAGNITYKNAEALRELAHNTPKDRILVETDAPFLSPQSKRGTVNNPKNIVETVTFLAELFNMPQQEFERLTADNSARFFSLSTR